MEGNSGRDLSMNDADSIADSPSGSSSGNDERGENGASEIGHELRAEDSIDEFDAPTRLCLNGEGEQWLQFCYKPDPRVQEYIDRENAQNSSEDDEKEEGRSPSAWTRDSEKANHAKTSLESIMQTQEEPSPSQKTFSQTQMHTQMQLHTQTQETITQQSVGMSLLEYLNQPTQDYNEEEGIDVGIGSSIKILSGDELSTLYSRSNPSASSSQYPPNASEFLCFEQVSGPIGAVQKSYMTVKDMRPPRNADNNPNSWEEEIELSRASQDSSIDWKPLSRRKLTILCPGDKIRIETKASDALETAVSVDPEISRMRNTLIVLTYQTTKRPSKIKSRHSLATMTEKKNLNAKIVDETSTNVDMNIDDESQKADTYAIPKDKTLESSNKGLNTFAGSPRRGEAAKIPQARDGVSPRSISSCHRPSLNTPGGVIDSSASVGVDSAINAQQESLRSSRMRLLDRNLALADDVEGDQANIENTNAANGSSVRNASALADGKDFNGDLQNDSMKEKLDDEIRVGDASLDATIQDDILGLNDSKTEKDPKDGSGNLQSDPEKVGEESEMKATNSSTTTTQDRENLEPDSTNLTKDSDGNDGVDDSSIGSDDSGKTIPLTQVVDYATTDRNQNDEDKTEDVQTSTCSNRDTEKKENFLNVPYKNPAEDREKIPRSIEIGDGDQEDGGRHPVSQLLLSMDTDNECEDDEKDEISTPALQGLQVCKTNARTSPNKEAVSNTENNESSVTFSVTEKLENERGKQKTSSTKRIAASVEQGTSQSNDKLPIPKEGVGNDLHGAVGIIVGDVMDDETSDESDDETVLGAVVMMNKTVNSSRVGEIGLDSSRNPNNSEGVDVDHEKNFNGEQRKVNDKEEESASTAITISVANGTVVEETGPRTRKNKEGKKPELPGGYRRTRAVETVDQQKRNPLQTRMKRKSSSMDRRSIIPESNQDVKEGTSPIPFGSNKRRRNGKSNKVTSTNNSIRATARAADEFYERGFNTAIKNNAISILVSGFEQSEMIHISKLCRTKFSNVKRFTIKEIVDNNISACILPTVSKKGEEASCRTLKAIQCALLGIPMVSLAWLERCKEEGKVIVPTSYIRTLPAKIGSLTLSDQARYGVARLAAERFREPQNPCLPFKNASIFLCGKYSSDKKKSLTKLLEQGSAKVATTSREALVKLESVMESSAEASTTQKRFVLLVGDRGISIPKSLQNEIFAALEDAKSRTIYVVDSSWVSYSIACAGMLPPAYFKPKCGEDLWEMSKDLPPV